ncbi:MAG TPA: UDP-N-acetyl-alpha-D-muramoyl-L-alanyl-L-glutamate epimerase, partial [Dokdonella sp.]|nr:UDP-N-acetyl-alpha-D-muramoyl-L-alanyl-L-glutamate epimerase [Dokdonella sp.]
MSAFDPRTARAFRFVRRGHADGVAELVYAFDDGAELVERIAFPDAPALDPARAPALDAALDLLHLIAGVSYYKAGVPRELRIETRVPDAATAAFLDALYLNGLGEFAYHNKLDLRGRIRFPAGASPDVPAAGAASGAMLSDASGKSIAASAAPTEGSSSPRRTLVPIGGGKDSLVSVEILKAAGVDATAVWVGNSPLIAACAARTGLPTLNIRRELSPLLFEYNKQGAYNGHIPVTAINSAILAVAAVLYGYDAIAFSNERSASSATLEYDGQPVNHQWSKGWDFERGLHERLHALVSPALDYYSLLRPLSELAVAERFARTSRYDDVFSSCNRNFRILGPKPADRWCGQCPKCHFVFLALAPFMPKPRLLAIFGRNLLDDEALAPAFDALMEYREHKPFECVGEGGESRAAMHALVQRAEWREDALVARFADEILPQLDPASLA